MERDPRKIKQLCEYYANIRNEIRRAYLKAEPYQPKFDNYTLTRFDNQNRGFSKKWFDMFYWLDYLPSTNKVYCFFTAFFS